MNFVKSLIAGFAGAAALNILHEAMRKFDPEAGLSAGIAAVKAPKPMGLNEKHVANSNKREIMTVAYYGFGAMVTAGVFGMISKK